MTYLLDERIKGFDLPRKTPGDDLLDKFETFKNPGNNLATDVWGNSRGYKEIEYNGLVTGKFCHIGKDKFFDRVLSNYVQGHGYEEILTWLNWARQAGIVKFWRDGRDDTDTRKNLKEHYVRWKKVGLTKGKWARGRVKVDWEGMGLNEKVAQLFGICGVILVTGGVAFVVERLRTVTYVQNV